MLDFTVKKPTWLSFDTLLSSGLQILIIVVALLVVRWIVKRLIGRVVKRAAAGTVPGPLAGTKAGELLQDLRPGVSERRQQRATAIGDLLGSIATLVLVAIAVVMVFDTIGVPIAPILTGAGILGVALGFGAQTLVKDYLAGLFMILEDQYGVGDSVDLGEASGTVEATGLRVTRLRDVNGTVWYVRNGEILRGRQPEPELGPGRSSTSRSRTTPTWSSSRRSWPRRRRRCTSRRASTR
ncbi:MAG: mechanosensitive ion channel [Aeromicrobium erythreum]